MDEKPQLQGWCGTYNMRSESKALTLLHSYIPCYISMKVRLKIEISILEVNPIGRKRDFFVLFCFCFELQPNTSLGGEAHLLAGCWRLSWKLTSRKGHASITYHRLVLPCALPSQLHPPRLSRYHY